MIKYVIKRGNTFLGFDGKWTNKESLAVHYNDYGLASEVANSIGSCIPVVASTN